MVQIIFILSGARCYCEGEFAVNPSSGGSCIRGMKKLLVVLQIQTDLLLLLISCSSLEGNVDPQKYFPKIRLFILGCKWHGSRVTVDGAKSSHIVSRKKRDPQEVPNKYCTKKLL